MVYKDELCLQDPIWRQERTRHNYQYRHRGVLIAVSSEGRAESILAVLHLHGSLAEISGALQAPARPFAAIPLSPVSGSLSRAPLTHCLGSAPEVHAWQHVSPLCCWKSSVCCLSSAGGRCRVGPLVAGPATWNPLTQPHLTVGQVAGLVYTQTHQNRNVWTKTEFSRKDIYLVN